MEQKLPTQTIYWLWLVFFRFKSRPSRGQWILQAEKKILITSQNIHADTNRDEAKYARLETKTHIRKHAIPSILFMNSYYFWSLNEPWHTSCILVFTSSVSFFFLSTKTNWNSYYLRKRRAHKRARRFHVPIQRFSVLVKGWEANKPSSFFTTPPCLLLLQSSLNGQQSIKYQTVYSIKQHVLKHSANSVLYILADNIEWTCYSS